MQNGDLRHHIGQLLILGFEGVEPSPALARLLDDVRPGGVILFARNIVSAEQTYELLAYCSKQSLGPLFRCVDLEGGSVDRLRNVIAPALSQSEVARTHNPRLVRRHGELLGAEARALGFNVDFAPVSDLGYERSRKVMGTRTISPEPLETIRYVKEFLRGLKQSGVLGCGKHYPGLGEGDLDSHHLLPEIEKPFSKLWNQDLLPYRRLHRMFPFIMVAHAAYPAVTGDRTPASLSAKWMHQVLRRRIGYKGIVLSDDLEMGGVLAGSSVESAAVETLRAGADMFLVCKQEEFVRRAYESVLREAERDRRFRERIRDAHARVVRFKRRAPELKKTARKPTAQVVRRLRSALEDFRSQVARATP
jgi:beta-N-acetylhexosaminidase